MNYLPGEPCALKGASTVRRGAVGNVITTVRMWITRAGRLPYKRVRVVWRRASGRNTTVLFQRYKAMCCYE
jgi:hypothetical protein